MNLWGFLIVAGIVIFILFCIGVSGEDVQNKNNNSEKSNLTSEEEKALIQDADNGDANAQFLVGLMYMTGKKSAFNSKSKAEKYLAASAKQGYIQSQLALGDLYFIYQYGEIAQGLFWYCCAYMQGNKGAMDRLNDMIDTGLPGGKKRIDKVCQDIWKNYRQYVPKCYGSA